MEAHQAPLAGIRQWVDTAARQLFPAVSSEINLKLSGCSWYLRPENHLAETLGVGILFSLVILYERNKAWTTVLQATSKRPHYWRLLDYVFGFVCFCVYLGTLYLKYSEGRMYLVVQPCHLHMLATIFLCLLPGHKGSKLFHVYIVTIFGPYMAAAFPDMRERSAFDVSAFLSGPSCCFLILCPPDFALLGFACDDDTSPLLLHCDP